MSKATLCRILFVTAALALWPGAARAQADRPLSAVLEALPWSKARAVSVSVLVQGREPLGEADAALVSRARSTLAAAAKARRPRLQLDLTGPAGGRARFAQLVELNLVPVASPAGSRVVADVTFFDLARRPSGGYEVATRTVRPAAGGAMHARFDVGAPGLGAGLDSLADRAAALAAHEQALRERAAARGDRTRLLVGNGEFSEVAVGSRTLLGLTVARDRWEDVLWKAYTGALGGYAALFAESAFDVRNRFVEAVDRFAEAELGDVPAWYDGRPAAGVRRLRATDESIEERPYYPTDGPQWAPYWTVVGPRREAVLAAFEQFLEDGGLVVLEDEHCSEEPLAGLLPARCEEVEDPARVDLRPASGAPKPERVSLRSPLWSRIVELDPEASCQPLVVAADRRRWPGPFAVRCDRPEGGVVVYTSFHADDLARDGLLAQALYGGADRAGALEAALLDAPFAVPSLQALRPDTSIATPVVVDRAALLLGAASEPIASADATAGARAAARSSLGIYVDAEEHGYLQVAFAGGPLRAELRSASGALVAARAADTPPLLLDLARRPRGLYEVRLVRDEAEGKGRPVVTVAHLSTVPRERWTGASIAAWGAQGGDAIVVDGFVRGTVGIPAEAVGRLRAEGATLVRLATTAGASPSTVLVEGHASEEGSDRANLALSFRRAVWAAGVLTSAAEVSSGAACTVPASGESCASWLSRLARRAGRTDAGGTVADLAIGGARVRMALRPLGARTPLTTCERRDEACHLRNRRVLVRLEK